MESRENRLEKAILVGLNASVLPENKKSNKSTFHELEALLETAGGQCVGKVMQTRPSPDSRTFIGEGKAFEIKQLRESQNADIVIFDNELSPSQMRNLENIINCAILDRSGLILDIFANRATSNEGKLQVELAQYQYILPRLSGLGKTMSRLGGGIGTRGPGETKLESDKRHIRQRIDRLKQQLEGVRKTREVQRKGRKKSQIPLVVIVGYTNAGKSTLLNLLADANIHANDRLFDTLDATTRKMKISDANEILITDTVGFIQKLPHHLINAFKSTLEEISYADLLLHVVDASDEDARIHIDMVNSVVSELGAGEISQILVLNKADKCTGDETYINSNTVMISAKYNKNIDKLLEIIEHSLNKGKYKIKVHIPFSEGRLLEEIHLNTEVISSQYTEDGTIFLIVCTEKIYGKLKDYVVKKPGGN